MTEVFCKSELLIPGIVAASGIDVIFHRNRTFDDEHTPALFEYNMLVDDLNERGTVLFNFKASIVKYIKFL